MASAYMARGARGTDFVVGRVVAEGTNFVMGRGVAEGTDSGVGLEMGEEQQRSVEGGVAMGKRKQGQRKLEWEE